MSHYKLRALLSRLAACATLTAASASSALASAPAVDDDPPSACDDCDCFGLEDDAPLDHGSLAVGDAAAMLGRGLAHALEEARPLAATQVAATWATSEDPVRRLALAHALERRFPLVGDSVMIEHLSRDADPAIRAASARAAAVRELPIAAL